MPAKYPILLSDESLGQNVDYIVYIMGVDVTEYITSVNVITDMNMGGIDIQLSNANNLLTLSKDNINGIWKNSIIKGYSEVPKQKIYDYKFAHNSEGPNGKLGFQNLRRWNLRPGQIVLHRMDTVRVYIRIPWLNRRAKNSWIPLFNGYLTSVTSSKTEASAENTLSVTGQNIKYVLKKARLGQNPNVTSIGAIADTVVDNAGLFRDVVLPANNVTTLLYNKEPEDLISFLIFGKLSDATAISKSSTLKALGSFRNEPGHIRFIVETFTSVPNGEVNSFNLETWHSGCIYGVDNNGNTRLEPLTLKEVEQQGEASAYGQPFSAHGENMVVRFLKPENGFGYQTLVQHTINDLTSLEADWTTRLDLIDTILAPLNYRFWVSGAGDLIFEFPLVDFKPSDFGDYYKLFKITKYTTSSYSENDVDIPTLLTVTGGNVAQNSESLGETGDRYFRIDITFASLAYRLGVNHETISFPYTSNQDSLLIFGLNTVQQRLSELESYSIDGIPILCGIVPNRPIWVPDLDMISTTTTTNISLSSSGEGLSMRVDMDYPRRRELDGKFRTIFGTESLPMSYVKLFDQTNNFKELDINGDFQNNTVYVISGSSHSNTITTAGATLDSPLAAPNVEVQENLESLGTANVSSIADEFNID